jgi:hypothetical protein
MVSQQIQAGNEARGFESHAILALLISSEVLSMKKFLSLILILLISACNSSAPTTDAPALLQPSPAPPTEAAVLEVPNENCIDITPTQDDVERALNFTGKIFENENWTRTYTVSADRVSVLWDSPSLGALAFLEALIFPCGYEDLDLDNFFSVDSWQIVFGGYESYEFLSECRNAAGQRLYEFALGLDGFVYDANYWSVNDTATRVVTMEIIFPVDSEILFDEFSYSLFPQIPSC